MVLSHRPLLAAALLIFSSHVAAQHAAAPAPAIRPGQPASHATAPQIEACLKKSGSMTNGKLEADNGERFDATQLTRPYVGPGLDCRLNSYSFPFLYETSDLRPHHLLPPTGKPASASAASAPPRPSLAGAGFWFGAESFATVLRGDGYRRLVYGLSEAQSGDLLLIRDQAGTAQAWSLVIALKPQPAAANAPRAWQVEHATKLNLSPASYSVRVFPTALRAGYTLEVWSKAKPGKR